MMTDLDFVVWCFDDVKMELMVSVMNLAALFTFANFLGV